MQFCEKAVNLIAFCKIVLTTNLQSENSLIPAGWDQHFFGATLDKVDTPSITNSKETQNLKVGSTVMSHVTDSLRIMKVMNVC